MTPFNLSITALLVGSALLLGGCGPQQQQQTASAQAEQKQLTEADAVAFLNETETTLVQLYKEANRAEWIYSNFITEDTASLAADVNEKLTLEMVQLATAAAKFDQVALSADSRRKLDKLKGQREGGDTFKAVALEWHAKQIGRWCPGRARRA